MASTDRSRSAVPLLGLKLLLGAFIARLALDVVGTVLSHYGLARFGPTKEMDRFLGAYSLTSFALTVLALVALALIARAPREARVRTLAWVAFGSKLVATALFLLVGLVVALTRPVWTDPSSYYLTRLAHGSVDTCLWLVEIGCLLVVLTRLSRWAGEQLGQLLVGLVVAALVVATLLGVAHDVLRLLGEPAGAVARSLAFTIVDNLVRWALEVGLVVAVWRVLGPVKRRRGPQAAPPPALVPPPGMPPGAA